MIIGCLLMLICPVHVLAGRNISFPFEESFDSGDVWRSDLCWVGGGATCSHLTSGCWSGGCAKFTPPTATSGQAMSGLGSFDFIDGTHKRVNIRVLMKVGSTYHITSRSSGYNNQNKLIIVGRQDNGDRGMTIFERYYDGEPHYFTFGACRDNDCNYECGGITNCWWPNSKDRFKSTDYLGQWFCLELEADLINKISKVYIWTQDGKLKGEYKTFPITDTSAYSYIQIIGGFYNGYHVADSNTYVMFDELKISNTFIGPPPGFLGGVPLAPNGLKVVE